MSISKAIVNRDFTQKKKNKEEGAGPLRHALNQLLQLITTNYPVQIDGQGSGGRPQGTSGAKWQRDKGDLG